MIYLKNLIVTNNYDKKKLSSFIFNSFPNLSRNTFFKALRQKDIKINGKRVNKDCTIFTGDELSIYIVDSLLFPKMNLNIVYEDDNILVVNKPVNIEVTGENSLATLINQIYKTSNIMPCHRLDRNTTGLVLFAKNEQSLNILLNKFKNHEIRKFYKALVYGIPKIKKARLEAYLFKDKKESVVYISDTSKKGYQKIVTSYNVLEEYDNNTSLLDVEIETGKTHQIRAHLAHIGYPIVGDGKYGINSVNKELGFKFQQLCSYKLQFCFKSDSGILNYLNNMIIHI